MNALKQVGWKYKINTCTEVPLNSSEHCFCTCSLPRARMCEGVKELVLSICQFVSPVKNVEISTFTGLNNCCTQQRHGNLKKNMYGYLIETKAVHSSAFPAIFYLTLVLSTILIRSTTWIRWRPGTVCGLQARVHVHQPPRSQDCEKLCGGLGTRLRIHLVHSLCLVSIS